MLHTIPSKYKLYSSIFTYSDTSQNFYRMAYKLKISIKHFNLFSKKKKKSQTQTKADIFEAFCTPKSQTKFVAVSYLWSLYFIHTLPSLDHACSCSHRSPSSLPPPLSPAAVSWKPRHTVSPAGIWPHTLNT